MFEVQNGIVFGDVMSSNKNHKLWKEFLAIVRCLLLAACLLYHFFISGMWLYVCDIVSLIHKLT